MNILLLGNGFDLYHNLPTRYIDFLHIADFLTKNYTYDAYRTVGQVLSDLKLQEKNPFIKRCYEVHKVIYDDMSLEPGKVRELIDYVKGNIWFEYFLSSLNDDVGWIDFEREIAKVIHIFDNLSKKFNGTSFELDLHSAETFIILKYFDFFVKSFKIQKDGAILYNVKKEYQLNTPFGSDIYIIQESLIIKRLFDQLEDFKASLKMYLHLFAEKVFDKNNVKSSVVTRHDALLYADYIITLNYTHTYENLYVNGEVFHLHGDIDHQIVLGINPDKYDDLETIDTSFIAFKKYYQRILYETDTNYLLWKKEDPYTKDNVNLTVMGHSLDITDRDIILDLFEISSKITILYHDESAKKSYIENLVKIFGREGFEQIRNFKDFQFLSIDSNFKASAEFLKSNSETYIQSLT